jgi:hypothetical protein
MPVERLRFKADNRGTYYIDLSKALSLQTRKLHRQKATYTVYGGYFVDSQGDRIDLNVAPHTWVTKRAINRGFQMWKKMTAKTLADSGSTSKSRYRDFKVYLDSQMTASNLSPKDASDNLLYTTAPEWDYSTLVSEDPEAVQQPGDLSGFELMIVGQHVGSNPDWSRISLVESWVNSRPSPEATQPENIPDVNDPLMNLMDAGDALDDRLTIINTEGDGAPYDELVMFGNKASNGSSNNLQRMSTAQPTANTQLVAPIHGFDAICGLIQVVVGSGSSANEWELVLDVESKGAKF